MATYDNTPENALIIGTKPEPPATSVEQKAADIAARTNAPEEVVYRWITEYSLPDATVEMLADLAGKGVDLDILEGTAQGAAGGNG